VVNNNRVRRELEAALAALKLFSPDRAERDQAITDLKDQADEGKLVLLEKAIAAEPDAELKARLELLRAAAMISSSDKAKRLAAAHAAGRQRTARHARAADRTPGRRGRPRGQGRHHRFAGQGASRLAWGERLGTLFAGISLGSILLLVALGLAITYGLMGVINMAHGELMMIGAYATYRCRTSSRLWLPAAFDWYIVLAVPASFLSAALVGAVLERTVIRWLYGRPLETLLATWGISLILMQTGAHDLRGAERGRGEPVVAVGWPAGAAQPDAALQPAGHRRLCRAGAAGHDAADQPHAAGPVCARRHAEPPHGRLCGREHGAHGHLCLCAGRRHCGPGRLRA
jgi:urea transport system permease protein